MARPAQGGMGRHGKTRFRVGRHQERAPGRKKVFVHPVRSSQLGCVRTSPLIADYLSIEELAMVARYSEKAAHYKKR